MAAYGCLRLFVFVLTFSMDSNFKMVAKTMKGLEGCLADELRGLGAANVEPGRRMVSFEGNLEMLYKANLCLRTALCVLKPFYSFTASDSDELYDKVKDFDWGSLMSADSTFSIDTVTYSATFNHSRYVTYRVKDGIVDWFRDRYDKRPGVRLDEADVMINVHIQDTKVTLSLNSSGESLHKRGWRVASTEAPINEVLAAGILLMAGYDGSQPLTDTMCGSGTFLVEAALIAANINPGVFRMDYAFRRWPDFDEELFNRLWSDDEHEREPENIIIGGDMLASAVQATKRNLKAAGVDKFVNVEIKKLSEWVKAPAKSGILVMNPPYGERIAAPDMAELYTEIGNILKKVFTGWNAWIISLKDEYFRYIGLAPSQKIALLNGSIDCELRQYIMFAGNKRDFRAAGGKLKSLKPEVNKPKENKKKTFGRDKAFAPKKSDARKESFKDAPSHRLKKETEKRTAVNFDTPDTVSDNPLAARRSMRALTSIKGKGPALPKSEGPIMRSRGWKKKNS